MCARGRRLLNGRAGWTAGRRAKQTSDINTPDERAYLARLPALSAFNLTSTSGRSSATGRAGGCAKLELAVGMRQSSEAGGDGERVMGDD